MLKARYKNKMLGETDTLIDTSGKCNAKLML